MNLQSKPVHTRTPRRNGGFTLVEVMIVVVIISILATIVLPQFSSATDESRENSLRMNLFRVRTQLQVYRTQHNDEWPSLANIEDQLTTQTDVDGNAGTQFGPYLAAIPVNPMTGTNTVGNNLDYSSSDWYYDELTGDFRANDSAEHSEL